MCYMLTQRTAEAHGNTIRFVVLNLIFGFSSCPPKYHPGDKLTGRSVTLLHIVSSSQHWQLRYRTGFVKISRSLVLCPTTFSFSSLHNSLISSWWIFAEQSSESLKILKSKRKNNNLTVIQQLQKIEIQFVREFGSSPPKLINNGSLKVKGWVSGYKHVGEDGNTTVWELWTLWQTLT